MLQLLLLRQFLIHCNILEEIHLYRPQRSCGKVMFLHLSCHSVQGVCPSACWDTHPPAQCMLGYTPLCPVHAGIDMATAADGMHPTGMHSCFSCTSLILKRLETCYHGGRCRGITFDTMLINMHEASKPLSKQGYGPTPLCPMPK